MKHEKDVRHAMRILELIDKAKETISQAGMDEGKFTSPMSVLDDSIVDGITFKLFAILEEAGRISDAVQNYYPQLDWDAMRGMRNHLGHGYFEADRLVVWKTIIDDVPQLKAVCIDYVSSQGIPIPEKHSLQNQRGLDGPISDSLEAPNNDRSGLSISKDHGNRTDE